MKLIELIREMLNSSTKFINSSTFIGLDNYIESNKNLLTPMSRAINIGPSVIQSLTSIIQSNNITDMKSLSMAAQFIYEIEPQLRTLELNLAPLMDTQSSKLPNNLSVVFKVTTENNYIDNLKKWLMTDVDKNLSIFNKNNLLALISMRKDPIYQSLIKLALKSGCDPNMQGDGIYGNTAITWALANHAIDSI